MVSFRLYHCIARSIGFVFILSIVDGIVPMSLLCTERMLDTASPISSIISSLFHHCIASSTSPISCVTLWMMSSSSMMLLSSSSCVLLMMDDNVVICYHIEI